MTDRYEEGEVRTWLDTALGEWRLEDGSLVRTYETGAWSRTMLLAGAIGFLAEARWHHPVMVLEFSRLTVRLRSHDADGITDRDLELAREIESTATWNPGEGSAFEGAPDGPIR